MQLSAFAYYDIFSSNSSHSKLAAYGANIWLAYLATVTVTGQLKTYGYQVKSIYKIDFE